MVEEKDYIKVSLKVCQMAEKIVDTRELMMGDEG